MTDATIIPFPRPKRKPARAPSNGDAAVVPFPCIPAVYGLGEPDLRSVYTARELRERDLLIEWLGFGWEPVGLPLLQFLSEAAVAATNQATDDQWDPWACGTDADVARLPGLTARDIVEARLSRNAFDAMFDIIVDQVADAEPEDSHPLDMIFPYSRTRWDFDELVARACAEVQETQRRIQVGTSYPAVSTAGEMILHYAIGLHRGYLEDFRVAEPWIPLEDAMLEDEDFLLLFDPRHDGIEDTTAAVEMGMTITDPKRWFDKFRRDCG